MKRVGAVWVIFGFCVAVAAAAMVCLGTVALTLERAEAKARHQAETEENLQLALWRMDSALAPLMAEESARPYFSYTSLYPAERAFTCMFSEIKKGDVLMPSPLLTFTSPRIRLHFQYGPDGHLTSPQVPAGDRRGLAEAQYVPASCIDGSTQRLEELGKLISRSRLAAALALEETTQETYANALIAYGPVTNSKSSQEYVMRSRATKLAQSAPVQEALPLTSRTAVSQGPLQAVWIGQTLVLARRVRVEEGIFLQGCWLDWDVIRHELLEGVADLAPHAALEPVLHVSGVMPTRMLASLPARLVPGPMLEKTASRWSPARWSLLIAWACLTLAATAIALVLHGALALSERRGTFVSAVSHELRTPLTTFRLYTEMLDEGMVPSVEAQRTYLKTLRGEADRLGHLVENVLAFARLERGRAADRHEIVDCTALLERLAPRLARRAEEAGMELVVGLLDVQGQVCVDVSVIDQILLNLVDNASKYASNAIDRRIHLDAGSAGRWLVLTVHDHGLGLPPRVVRRLFRPFSKSANDAANSAPGVGLGLALSRRLARAMQGDLHLQRNSAEGAWFALTIPLA